MVIIFQLGAMRADVMYIDIKYLILLQFNDYYENEFYHWFEFDSMV